MHTPLLRYVALFVIISMLAMNPQIIHKGVSYLTGGYHSALQATHEKQLPSYIIRPGQKPQHPTFTFDGKDKHFKFGDDKATNFGISINDEASNKKLGKTE